MIFVGENMKNIHDQIVSIAVLSSELLECVQWDQPAEPATVLARIAEMKRLLQEIEKEMTSM
jgi:hypothetical protein